MAEAQTEKTNNEPAALKDWTSEERYRLLQALKVYGRKEIEKIQEYISSKTIEETGAAIDHYVKTAQQHPTLQKQHEPKVKVPKKPRVPLAAWAKLLTDSLSLNELHTETATALRLIADLEDIPQPVGTDNIDFRKVYHQIANALEGKPVNPDLATTAVLHKCLVETALSSKAFIKTAAYKYIINNIDLSDREINMFPRPTKNHELSILRHLASQRSYNPLQVPEEYLKPSCESTVLDNKHKFEL